MSHDRDWTLQKDASGELGFTGCSLQGQIKIGRVSGRLLVWQTVWCGRKLTHSLSSNGAHSCWGREVSQYLRVLGAPRECQVSLTHARTHTHSLSLGPTAPEYSILFRLLYHTHYFGIQALLQTRHLQSEGESYSTAGQKFLIKLFSEDPTAGSLTCTVFVPQSLLPAKTIYLQQKSLIFSLSSLMSPFGAFFSLRLPLLQTLGPVNLDIVFLTEFCL